MVLSNKKLKNHLRTQLFNQTNPENPFKSLKQDLNSNTQNPNLSKMDKNREKINSLELNGEKNDTQKPILSKMEKKMNSLGFTGEKNDTQNPILSKRDKNSEKMNYLEINGEKNDTHVVETSNEKKGKRKRGKNEGKMLGLEEVEEIQRLERKRIKNEKRKLRLKDENGRRIRVKKEGGEGGKEGEDLGVGSRKKKGKKKKKKAKSKSKIDEGEKEIGGDDGGFDEKIVDEVKVVDEGKVVEETSQVNEADDDDDDDENKKKVYVGGMSFSSTEDDIWNYFDHCGAIVDIDCMKFPESGKFRGIAIISFKTQEAAKKALALDGSDMDGLYLKVQPFKPTRTAKSSNFSTPVIEGYNRIYAGNLSWDITEDDLRKFFSNCNISSIRFGEDKETGEFKGYAHVDFGDSASLTKALESDQKVVCGRPVKISRAVPMKAQKNLGSISTPPPAVKPEENNTEVVSGKIRRRTCYECGEKGHLSSACPKKQATEQSNSNAS